MSEFDEEIDREYSPSSMIDDIGEYIEAYADRSAQVRSQHHHATLSFGAEPDDLIHIFPATQQTPIRGLHVFVHGGYWQQLSRHDSSFPAPDLTGRGLHFAAVDYTLAPLVSLPQIVDQVCAALEFLQRSIRNETGDALPMIISGHSAGAQLAAMAGLKLRPGSIAALVLISGVYELAPLLSTSVNDAVGLDLRTALAMSPLRLIAPSESPIDTLCVVGEVETESFKEQNHNFAEAWREAGNPTIEAEITGRNHFDVIFDLADPTTDLGTLVLDQEARIHPT